VKTESSNQTNSIISEGVNLYSPVGKYWRIVQELCSNIILPLAISRAEVKAFDGIAFDV